MILQILFWTSVFLVFHSYVLYPVILKILARGKEENRLVYSRTDNLPFVSVILAVHNEEMVIVEKIRSIYYTLYPLNRLEVLVGSDNSTDGTNRICRVYTGNYQNFRFFEYGERQGKPAIINKLADEAKGDILVLTDAKVFFQINTLFELIRHFKNENIAVIGGNILSQKTKKNGISFQEKAFMDREMEMKYNEGLIWGETIGVYGALYAIRKEFYTPVPEGFSVDDFYISMKVLEKNGKAIISKTAFANEEVPNEIHVEFRRKIRISAGNFINLKTFRKLLFKPWKSVGFAFLSHKVIRWITPFLILFSYVFSILLMQKSNFFQVIFYVQTLIFIAPMADFFLRKINIHIVFLRFISHFLIMNLALFIGFWKNLFGFKTNIWQPTKR